MKIETNFDEENRLRQVVIEPGYLHTYESMTTEDGVRLEFAPYPQKAEIFADD